MAISKSQAALALSGLTVISVPAIVVGVMNTSFSKEEKKGVTPTIWKTLKSDSNKFGKLKSQLCGIFDWTCCSKAKLGDDVLCTCFMHKTWEGLTSKKLTKEGKSIQWSKFRKNVEGIANGIKETTISPS